MEALKKDKSIGTIIGCGVGDSLGMPVEGWKPEQIKKYAGRIVGPVDPVIVKDKSGNILEADEFGKIKCWNKNLKKGDVTDDTILTLALLGSLGICAGSGKLDMGTVAKGQIKAYESNHVQSFGKTTKEAFANLQKGISPEHSGVIGGPGNAPPMKMAPLGMYMDAKNAYEEGLLFAEKVGLMTHLDPRSVAAGVMQAHAVYSLLQGTNKEKFLSSLVDVCRRFEKPLEDKFTFSKSGTLLERMRWIIENKDGAVESAYQHLGNTSSVYRSYPFTLFMFQKYWDQPLEGLLETINYGGDCDTTGAMFGALAGAKHGNIFPKHWLNEDTYFLLEIMSGIFYAACANSIRGRP